MSRGQAMPSRPRRSGPRPARSSKRAGSKPRTSPSKRPVPGNLPVLVDALIGRDRELEALEALVGTCRLVTLTGAPGVGKSRLGLEVARELADGCDGGAWLVELAPLGDAALVPGAAAAALSVGEVPGRSFVDGIVARVGERRAVIVLDNCEHLIGACSELVVLLLAACPGLRIVATSREPLHVADETAWQVPTLSTPAQAELVDVEALMECAGVRLFVERAAAVEPGFALNSYLAPAVGEICRRLDGIPLAIELAAARIELLTPAEIAERLDDRFDLLTGGSRALLAHHQTLESALDWSHELLSPIERALFRRCSVFLGGFDLESCGAVCSGAGIEDSKVAAVLDALIAKSLIVADRGDESGVRYRQLETLRAFAGERLDEAGETRERRESHARFYLELAERAEPDLTGPDQERWFTRLEAERANLRSALDWSLGHGKSEWALRLAGALVLFWRVRCHFTEGRDLLRAAVAAGNCATPTLRSKALWGAGFMNSMAGDHESAIATLEESLTLARECGNLAGTARALLLLGNCSQYCGPADSAIGLLDQSAALACEARDSWCLSHALALAGFGYVGDGDLRAARPLFEECLRVAREAQDAQGIRLGLLGLANVAVDQGEWVLAESLWEEAAIMADELGEPYLKAIVLGNLGELAIGRGEIARARELLDEAVTVSREVGPAALTSSLADRAHLARAEDDRGYARRLLEQALALTRSCEALGGMGELLAEEGKTTAARRLFEEALEHARATEEKGAVAGALYRLGELARQESEIERAAILHTEALELRCQKGTLGGIVVSLEALAGVAALSDRGEYAARVFGAASALREKLGFARLPWESARFDADVQLLRGSVPEGQLIGAWCEGERAELDDVVARAVDGQDSAVRVSRRWSSLTVGERRVATLAAEGLTNVKIASRLHISPWTVKTHLSRIYRKLSVAGRTELARAARIAEHPCPSEHAG